MSLRDEQLAGTDIVAHGTFKLDRRRAMEKMSRFQLEDPHRYVLELVAAAVRGGASEIHVRNDSDDFEISWDGEAPTAEELDFLFDHVFTRSAEDRPRMLQHFAQGLFGALGLGPSWVRVERPGVRYDMTDPLDIQRESCERTEGVFVHVRERFGWAVVRELMNPWDGLHERNLLKRFAWTCPVPLVVNGKTINRSHPPLELIAGSPARSVALVRDGIIVHHEHVPAGEMRVTGVLVDDHLALNASRSKVVRDKHWETVVARLVQTAVQAVQEDEGEDPDLRSAGLFLLQHHLRHATPLATRKLFVDGGGRRFSLQELRKARVVYTYPAAVAPDPTLEAPHFLVGGVSEVLGASDLQWGCLRERVGGLRDGRELLQSRHQGRERRRQLAQIVSPLSFMPAAVAERRFSSDGAEGAVALGATSSLQEGKGSFRAGPATIELRVDGLPVQRVITNRLPEGMSARVGDPDLRADTRFERVVQSPTYHRLLDLVVQNGHALLLEEAAQRPQQTVVRKALIRWLHTLRPKGRWTRSKFESVPEGLRKALLWRTCGGEPRCLEDMAQGASITTIRGADLMPELVLVSKDELVLVRRLLPPSVQDCTQDVENALVRATRLSLSKLKPKLPTYCTHKLAIETEGLTGELGLTDSEMDCRVTVLHQGVHLGEHTLDLLPGVQVIVEWADALPDARMENLEDLAQLEALADQLRPLAIELITQAARKRHPDLPFSSWLADALRRGLVDDVPLFVNSEGKRMSVSQLVPPVNVSSRPLDHSWPTVQPLFIVDTLRLRALRDRLGVGAVNDLTHRVEERVRTHQAFMQRPETPVARASPLGIRGSRDLPKTWGAEEFEFVSPEGTVEGVVGLSVNADLKGIRIAFLLEKRTLCTIASPSEVPAEAQVRNKPGGSKAIQPTNHWDGVLQQDLVTAVQAHAAEAVQRLVNRVAQPETTPKPPVVVARMVLATLSTDHPLAEVPLLQTIDGPMISLKQVLEAERVYTVPSDLASGILPPDRKAVWIRLGAGTRRVLDAFVGATSDGARTLERLRAGMARRASMHRVGLAAPGDYAATLTRSDGSTHLWLGLSEDVAIPTMAGASLAWIIEDRVVSTEDRSDLFPCARNGGLGVFRVTDDELRANDAFDQPRDGPARDRCLALLKQTVQEIGPLAGQALQQDSDQPSLWDKVRGKVETGVRVLDHEALRRILVRSLVHPSTIDEAWRGIGLLWTSDGRTLDPFDLDQVARKGPLRVVPMGTVGRTLDTERPAILANIRMRSALHGYREVLDYSEQLIRDETVHKRRESPAAKPTPDPAAILVRELPAPWRGHLEVHGDGRTGLVLYIAWRAVESRSHDGCVPLVVHLDADFVPDADWRRVETGPLLVKALYAMKDLSDGLLNELVELDPDGQHHPGLWHRVIPRTFKHRRQIKPSATGARGRIAKMPIFQTGEGTLLSPVQVLKLRKPLWVPQQLAVPSGQKDRPFLVIPPTGLGDAMNFWGGMSGAEVAKARQETLGRRQAARKPWRLPSSQRWLARKEENSKTLKALVGLDPRLPLVSHLEARVDGVPVQIWEARRWPGMAGMVEVSEKQVDENFQSVRRTRGTDKALDALYAQLVKAAAPIVRDSFVLRRNLITLLKELNHNSNARAAWLDAELLEGPSNVSLAQASEGTVIWGTVAGDAKSDLIVLYPDPVTRELLEALAIDHQEAHSWRAEQRQVVTDARALKAGRILARKREALKKVLVERLTALSANMEGARSMRSAVIADWPGLVAAARQADSTPEHLRTALADPTSEATWLLAWEQLDQELVTKKRWRDAAEVAVRTAEKTLNPR